jgi:hypothetical protein
MIARECACSTAAASFPTIVIASAEEYARLSRAFCKFKPSKYSI